MNATERVDYTSMEFGQTVDDQSGIIAICPKCGLNGLKQTSGSRDMVRYVHEWRRSAMTRMKPCGRISAS